jgi:trimeric autotransporter adhesin
MQSFKRFAIQPLILMVVTLLLSPFGLAAVPNNGNWQGFGGVPGCNGIVYASAALPNGDLIFGGDFTMCGDVKLSNIGVYKPSSGRWRALGTVTSNGTDGVIFSIATSGNIAYVGGRFTQAREVSVANIAQVNVNNGVWSDVGTGAGGTVKALLIANGELVAGGSFTTIGGTPANRIARWNGIVWSPLGTGTNGGVTALAVSGNNIFAGGNFTTAGIAGATKVAQWDGNGWSALGSGPDHSVEALAIFNGELHSGGRSGLLPELQRWNGSAWIGLNILDGTNSNGGVTALRTVGDKLLIGGPAIANGRRGAFAWNGASLTHFGAGVSGGVFDDLCLTVIEAGGSVYCGGQFSKGRNDFTSAIGASNIARFDGAQWRALGSGNGIDDPVRALEIQGTTVYAGGAFRNAGSTFSPLVAAWNGTWSALLSDNSNPQGSVEALDSSATDLFAGGLSAIGFGTNDQLRQIARFNGIEWLRLSATDLGGPGREILAVAVDGSNVYVGGSFTSIGGVAANNIARWDGTAWNAVGAGVNGAVYSIEPAQGANTSILVGGEFTQAGALSASNIARWDGTSSWSAVGVGVNGPVFAIRNAFFEIAVGGRFSSAGGVAANNIARLSGNSFSAYGSGTNGQVNAISFSVGNIWVGGEFVNAGGALANNIARWDIASNDWAPLGFGAAVGTDKPVRALAIDSTGLYVGGDFVLAGDGASAHIAKFVIDGNQLMSTGFEGQ